MKDVKSFFEVLKEWWKDPKKKGIIQILFWVLFFTLIAVFYRTSSSIKNIDTANKNNSKTNEKSENVDSYEYEYDIHSLNDNTIIKGTYFDDKEVFYINNNKYYQIDKTYYDEKTNLKINPDYPLEEWEYKNIVNIMKNFKYSDKTSYKSGIVKYEYNITSLAYNNYYTRNYQNDIIIDITLTNNLITEANINYTDFSVDIKYSNINEIDNLDLNIEKR